ncbi:MAG: methyltransferase, partial [Minicystis sp.]
ETRSTRDALLHVLDTLLPVRDIVEGRVDQGVAPLWCDARGWTPFLLSLDTATLTRCEEQGLLAGLAHHAHLDRAPPDLLALAHRVADLTRLPTLETPARPPPARALRAVPSRKRLQLSALLGAIGIMAERAARIVDVGAGRGHLTRIAASVFDRDTLGLEREIDRVASAATLAASPEFPSEARFLAFDACREELAFLPDDLALGLHACGEVGDRLVLAAATAGCDLALVSCCLQKIEATARAPLSQAAKTAGFTLAKDSLGLTNLSSRAVGVETSLEATMDAREARHALALLLRRRGVALPPGEAMRGINRRQAHRGFRALADHALTLRRLAPLDETEHHSCAADAHADFARARRLSLPRSLLARLTELAVVLDRAAALEESGHAARVAVLFEAGVTPRNLALFASRAPERLPR